MVLVSNFIRIRQFCSSTNEYNQSRNCYQTLCHPSYIQCDHINLVNCGHTMLDFRQYILSLLIVITQFNSYLFVLWSGSVILSLLSESTQCYTSSVNCDQARSYCLCYLRSHNAKLHLLIVIREGHTVSVIWEHTMPYFIC